MNCLHRGAEIFPGRGVLERLRVKCGSADMRICGLEILQWRSRRHDDPPVGLTTVIHVSDLEEAGQEIASLKTGKAGLILATGAMC